MIIWDLEEKEEKMILRKILLQNIIEVTQFLFKERASAIIKQEESNELILTLQSKLEQLRSQNPQMTIPLLVSILDKGRVISTLSNNFNNFKKVKNQK